jgi:hypothetical protein
LGSLLKYWGCFKKQPGLLNITDRRIIKVSETTGYHDLSFVVIAQMRLHDSALMHHAIQRLCQFALLKAFYMKNFQGFAYILERFEA